MTRSDQRAALVLSGGGARGAYEVGVLSYLFEKVYPELPEGFEFDVVSGTSVGAIHAAYVAATAHQSGRRRARMLIDTWRGMRMQDVLQVNARDLFGIPLRALGLTRLHRRLQSGAGEVVGGLVDLSPLERVVSERIPWTRLRSNLAVGRPGVLCVSCTEVRSGRITVFLDGRLTDTAPWSFDPNAQALAHEITADHVRASAAIPFLFPSVRIGERYYVDGGMRMNTPLSPALRLGTSRVLVVALKHAPGSSAGLPTYPEEVITQPAFLMGKVLNALLLDQLEYELGRVSLVNAWIEQGEKVFGEEFLERINVAVRAQRGVDYRPVRIQTIRPGEDVGHVASRCYESREPGSLGWVPRLLTEAARHGVPEGEADLLSYLLFDGRFTGELIDMGYEDSRQRHDELVALLAGE